MRSSGNQTLGCCSPRYPGGSRWCALDATFEGAFPDRYPGRWAPVPWIAEDRPHLILIADSDRFVHVVVETPSACFCTAVHAFTDSQQLRADLPSLQGYPRVLSIPDEELQHGTTLRDGDVVLEVVGLGYRRNPISFGIWVIIATVSHFRGHSLGSIGLLSSLHYAFLCDAGSLEARAQTPQRPGLSDRALDEDVAVARGVLVAPNPASAFSHRMQGVLSPLQLCPSICGTRILLQRATALIPFLAFKVK